MSLRTSSAGMSESSTAWAPNCSARMTRAFKVRLATTMRLTPNSCRWRATRVMVSPAPISKSLAALQVTENLFGQADRGKRHGNRVFTDRRVGAHLFSGIERCLE